MVCTKCNIKFPKKMFGPDAQTRSGKSSWCKGCKSAYQREYTKKRKQEPDWKDHHNLINRSARVAWYGLTDADYDEILSLQGGKCAGCGMLPKPNRRLDIDHQHQPGDKKREPWERASRVRGLLCHLCNRALGLLHDNLETFKNLANYLESPPSLPVLIPKFQKIMDYLEDPPAHKVLYSSKRELKKT